MYQCIRDCTVRGDFAASGVCVRMTSRRVKPCGSSFGRAGGATMERHTTNGHDDQFRTTGPDVDNDAVHEVDFDEWHEPSRTTECLQDPWVPWLFWDRRMFFG